MFPLLLLLSTIPLVIAEYPCSGGYSWYAGLDGSNDGYCVTASDDFLLDEPQAIQYCDGVGSFAPSIHNQKQLDYWSDMTVTVGVGHFWLGTNCPHEGDPYTWTDKTKMDFFGPNRELLSCKKGNGYHIHSDGLVLFALVDDPTTSDEQFSAAPALCVYAYTFLPTTTQEPTTAQQEEQTTNDSDEQTPENTTSEPTTTTTTVAPPTVPTTTAYSPPLPDLNEAYCSCNPEGIYLDVVFVVDNSADMTSKMLGDAIAAIQSTLYVPTWGDQMFQTQIAVVSFASDVNVIFDFGYLQKKDEDIYNWNIPHSNTKSTKMTSAIETATGLISNKARSFTRGVIILLSNSYNQLDDTNIAEASESFQDDGGVFVSIDYSSKGLAGMKKIASPGYYINSQTAGDFMIIQITKALCDANCFCSDGLTPYDTMSERETPLGCYHTSLTPAVFDAADNNCRNEKGFIATAHDTDKSFFLLSLFDKSKKYWIGYQRKNGDFKWEDNSKDGWTNWAAKNPVANKDCVVTQQTTGFNTQWFSADCKDPINASHLYACQLRPCDSTYNCWV